jgi:uncharacterized membrane protein YczE
MGWIIIVLLSILIVFGLGVRNIVSLVKKWKVYPQNWADLLVGIVIWCVALGFLVLIFIKSVPG